MYTNLDKAIVAAIMGIVGLLGIFVPSISQYVSPQTVGTIVSVATPVLVYLLHNLPKDS